MANRKNTVGLGRRLVCSDEKKVACNVEDIQIRFADHVCAYGPWISVEDAVRDGLAHVVHAVHEETLDGEDSGRVSVGGQDYIYRRVE